MPLKNRIKSPFLAALVLCTTLSGFGQAWLLGAKGGISIPNLTPSGFEKTPVSKGYNTRLGPDAALFGEYRFSHLFSLELDLQYSSQGGKKDGKQAIPVTEKIKEFLAPTPAPEYLYSNFYSEIKINYFMVPLLAKFSFDLGSKKVWTFYADGGPFAAWLLSATGVARGTSEVYLDEAETQPLAIGAISFDSTGDIKSQLRNFNFGVEANIGLTYHSGLNSFFAEAGGSYGFITLQIDPTDGQNHTGALVFRLGYARQLRPKGRRAPGSSSSAF
jgi:Outer membrane protein beta-barrel domain